MEHASYSAAMNHFTRSFIHIHRVWHGLKYYTVLLMCCACKCVHLISDLFNTVLIFKKIFFFCGEGCGRVNFLIVFVFCFVFLFLKQYEGENAKTNYIVMIFLCGRNNIALF